MTKIWVKAAPLQDKALEGRAKVPRPECSRRYFTESPELAEKTPEIMRLLLTGDLIEVPPVEEKPE
jgi:hypothetical protein